MLQCRPAVPAERRGSQRQKDLADTACIVEAFPEFLPQVPADLRQRLFDL
jgi:hypothetical protein